MYSPLSPPAAVHLIHDPTIVRRSSAQALSVARGDTHDDNKIYSFQRNPYKWRQCLVQVCYDFRKDMTWKIDPNILFFSLLSDRFNTILMCFP